MQEISKQLLPVVVEMVRSALSYSHSDESPVVSSDEDNGSHRDSEDTRSCRTSKQLNFLGFKEVRSHVKCFCGKKGEDDFQLWMEDYKEASKDYQWSDQDSASLLLVLLNSHGREH